MKNLNELISLNSEIYSLLQSFSITSDPETKQELIDKFDEFSMLFYEDFPIEATAAVTPVTPVIVEVEAQSEPEAETEAEAEAEVEEPVSVPKAKVNLSGVFTINDRFLYIREIFEGDANRFKTALEEMMRLGNKKAVEEYMSDILNLDPEKEAEAAFMETILKQF